MKNRYWIGGQAMGPNYSGAFGQVVTITGGVLMPEHLAPGGDLQESVRRGFPASVQATLQIVVTSIFKFEDGSADDTFRTEVLKRADRAEKCLSEPTADRQLILEDLIHVLRTLS